MRRDAVDEALQNPLLGVLGIHGRQAPDVAAVLAWAEATASPDRTYTLYALVHCDGAAGLVRLAGTDPTMSE